MTHNMPHPEIKAPSPTTLKKYGLTAEEWLSILASQGNVCPICGKFPSTGRFVTDHYHVRGYKKLPPESRKKFVRGITCWYCNHAYLGRGITLSKAENMVKYLDAFGKKMTKLLTERER